MLPINDQPITACDHHFNSFVRQTFKYMYKKRSILYEQERGILRLKKLHIWLEYSLNTANHGIYKSLAKEIPVLFYAIFVLGKNTNVCFKLFSAQRRFVLNMTMKKGNGDITWAQKQDKTHHAGIFCLDFSAVFIKTEFLSLRSLDFVIHCIKVCLNPQG